MISLAAVFAAVFLVVNGVLHLLVVRPVRQIARVADRLSRGDMSAEAFPQRGAEEIASLTRSFGRMRKSLEKALRLLEQ
jgi:protein-histidine pros-kinase